MKALLCGIALLALLTACKFPGDTTNAPTAGKTYWIVKTGAGCAIVTAQPESSVAGPFATLDNAKRAKDAEAVCKV